MPRSGSSSRPRLSRGRRAARDSDPRVSRGTGANAERTRHQTRLAGKGERRFMSHAPLTPMGNGVLAAVLAVLVTAGSVLVLTSVGWVFAADHTSAGGMFSFAGSVWLAGHLLPVYAEGMTFWLPPLLLTAAFIAVGALVGREAVRRGLKASAPAVRRFLLSAVGTYAALATLVAALSATATFAVPLLAVPFATALIFGLGLALGLWLGTGRRDLLKGRIRRPDELRAAGVNLMWLAAGAFGVLLVALAASLPRMWASVEWLRPGWSGSLLLLLLTLMYLPTAVLWAAAFVLGPGFSAGVSTVISPAEVTVGPLPQLPALAALPQTHTWWFLVVLLVPFIAALRAQGWLLSRESTPSGLRRRWGTAARAAGWAGVFAGLAALLADGGVGGRLSELGPSPLLISAAAGTWMLLGAAVVEGWRWVRGLLLHRSSASTAPRHDQPVEAPDVGTAQEAQH